MGNYGIIDPVYEAYLAKWAIITRYGHYCRSWFNHEAILILLVAGFQGRHAKCGQMCNNGAINGSRLA